MRLKRFNESKENYYKEVGDEWYDFLGIDITNKIFSKIKSLIDEEVYTLKVVDSMNDDRSEFHSMEIFRISTNVVDIYQADDDWFWVSCEREGRRLGGRDYYKCDQDTGLIMLLKDKGII
jgi:hypothetical protein